MPRKMSIRALAQTLRLAPSTVSDALRGRGRVAAGTVRRVQDLARDLGYRTNPLTSTVLSGMRRTKGTAYRGTLATIDLHEPTHWPHGPFPGELVAGARVRAKQMGFSIEEFVAGAPGMSMARIDGILKSRGIHGVIVLPSWQPADLSGLDWSRYAGLFTDSLTTQPALHSVCNDHYGSMIQLLERLAQRGYRRPGLLMEQGRDLRIQHRQTGAFRAFQHNHPEIHPVPVLITPGEPDVRKDFLPWLRQHEPDVVLSHFMDTLTWLEAAATRRRAVPGFVLLNVLERRRPCAAIDLQPRQLGARAAELVIGQLLSNELGVPASPSRNMLLAKWVEGPTVRPPSLRLA